MDAKRKTLILVLLPALLATLADALMTALRQNNWSNVAEAEPLARPFLALGPFAWALFVLAYLAVYLLPPFLLGLKSQLIAEVCSVFLTGVHCIGVISWCGVFLPGGVPAVEFYSMAPALLWFIFRICKQMQPGITYSSWRLK